MHRKRLADWITICVVQLLEDTETRGLITHQTRLCRLCRLCRAAIAVPSVNMAMPIAPEHNQTAIPSPHIAMFTVQQLNHTTIPSLKMMPEHNQTAISSLSDAKAVAPEYYQKANASFVAMK